MAAGITPTIWYGWLPMIRDCSNAAGALPKLRCANPRPTIADRCASSRLNSRPDAARTPNTRKKSG